MKLEDIRTDFDVFLHVKDHLLTQGKKSLDRGSGSCLYRFNDPETGEYLSCAIGCLINENEYYDDLEERMAYEEQVQEVLLFSLPNYVFQTRSVSMLSALQWVHDEIDPKNWEVSLNTEKWQFHLDGTFISTNSEYTVVVDKRITK